MHDRRRTRRLRRTGPMTDNDRAQRSFRLDAGPSTLIIAMDGTTPFLLYGGSRVSADFNADTAALLQQPLTPHGVLDDYRRLPLYPGDRGVPGLAPALEVAVDGHARLIHLALDDAEGADASGEAQTLSLSLVDERLQLNVVIEVRATPSGLFEYTTTLENHSDGPLDVVRMAAFHVSMPERYCELLRMGGFWANEFQARREKIADSTVLIESLRGRSSHGSSPAVLIGEPGFSEERGSVMSAALCWSGNHRLQCSRASDGSIQLLGGIPLRAGELRLGPGERFRAPTSLLCFSDKGMNGIREQHRRYWTAQKAPRDPRSAYPIHFNSWEGCYFDHDEASTCTLIDAAAELGAERFVLDDGWMAGREASGAGLGDWTPCPRRYPQGLGPVAAHARSRGLEFGLWIEPEMVTPDSQLAAAHPDWLIGIPGQEAISGRQQYLLNISLPEVRQYLLARLQCIVEDCRPDYLKWDMNRDYAQTGSEAGASALALAIAFGELFDRVRAAFPDISIEICAAGGARADCGALARCERIWPSDSMDPLQRFEIARNASLWLPMPYLGTHVGHSPASTSGRRTPLGTRCAVALCGHAGLELDPGLLSAADRRELADWLQRYRDRRHWLLHSKRLFIDTCDTTLAAMLAIDEEYGEGLLWILRTGGAERGSTSMVKLPGLQDDANYRLELLNPQDCSFAQDRPPYLQGQTVVASGEVLRTLGLRPPALQIAYCAVFDIRRCDIEAPGS